MKIKYLTGLAVLCLFTIAQQAVAEIPAEERAALIALYHATDGDNWRDNTGWLGEPGTECGWRGISCIAGPETIRHVNGIFFPSSPVIIYQVLFLQS